MTKPQTLRIDDMVTIDPITSAQEEAMGDMVEETT